MSCKRPHISQVRRRCESCSGPGHRCAAYSQAVFGLTVDLACSLALPMCGVARWLRRQVGGARSLELASLHLAAAWPSNLGDKSPVWMLRRDYSSAPVTTVSAIWCTSLACFRPGLDQAMAEIDRHRRCLVAAVYGWTEWCRSGGEVRRRTSSASMRTGQTPNRRAVLVFPALPSRSTLLLRTSGGRVLWLARVSLWGPTIWRGVAGISASHVVHP